MNTRDVALDFTDMLKQGRDAEAAAKYNAPDIVSLESMDGPMAKVSGADGVRQKGEWWVANHEVHSATVQGPYVHGDQFAVHMAFDFTRKVEGDRINLAEVGLYTVRDGKIVEERFFYL
ncbi:SnoaL-like domain-containing protein [Phreatobacter sp.]|uniref:SnoaL-like domain-containing protein n=1 Tax=Phreatobacter sp. TaxID=1966341 RepID=UPI003F710952